MGFILLFISSIPVLIFVQIIHVLKEQYRGAGANRTTLGHANGSVHHFH
jgi:hypothetical protein